MSSPAPTEALENAVASPALQNVAPRNWLDGLDNPYFQAGFGLMGVGVVLGGLRKFASFADVFLRRRLLVQVEVSNKDRAYPWLLAWMSEQNQINQRGTGSLLSRTHRLSVATTVEQHQNGSSSVFFNLIAGTGMHWIKYRDVWMQAVRERDTRSTASVSQMIPWETVTLTTLSRDRDVFPQLLAEARDLAMRDQEGKLVIQTQWGTEWRPFGLPRRKRPLHSVVLEDGVAATIEKDIQSFLQRRQWYVDRGIPYRRGYLFYGPPGSGKSSYIQALAGALNYNLCVLNLSERGLADDKLIHLLSLVPERSFVLMEDVDAAFNKRVQTSEDGYQSSVTFSGFLNALDGVASGEERIVFLTTNHIERLDAALIRPGRVDLAQYFGDAAPTQGQRLFENFYGAEFGQQLHDLLEEEMENGRRISMAALQGIFIRNDDPQDALAACRHTLLDIKTKST